MCGVFLVLGLVVGLSFSTRVREVCVFSVVDHCNVFLVGGLYQRGWPGGDGVGDV